MLRLVKHKWVKNHTSIKTIKLNIKPAFKLWKFQTLNLGSVFYSFSSTIIISINYIIENCYTRDYFWTSCFSTFENRNVLTNNSSCDEWIRLFRLNKTRLISLGLEILSKCLKLVLNHVIILEEIESKSWVTIIYKIRWREYRNYNICFESFLKRIWTVINRTLSGLEIGKTLFLAVPRTIFCNE